jgi:hypothetical protein
MVGKMKSDRALQILRSLLDGNDPFTKAALPSDSLFQNAELFRALRLAERALVAEKRREYRRDTMPANVGQGWTEEEKERLTAAYLAGKSIPVLAEEHGRTRRAIAGRLLLLGILRSEDGAAATHVVTDGAQEPPVDAG